MGHHFSSWLTSSLNLCLIYFKSTWALSKKLEHMHKKFEISQTKIKGNCQSGRKVVTHNANSDLPLIHGNILDVWLSGRTPFLLTHACIIKTVIASNSLSISNQARMRTQKTLSFLVKGPRGLTDTTGGALWGTESRCGVITFSRFKML